jgi:hypothetical protein
METALGKKAAVSTAPGAVPPAALQAGTPRHAGISGKKKGPETIRALWIGGLGSTKNSSQPVVNQQLHGK